MKFERNLLRKINWKSVIFYALLIAWPIIQFCVFYIGVNGSSIVISLKEFDSEGNFVKWGFGNFANILKSNVTTGTLGNDLNMARIGQATFISVLTYVLTVVISVPLGLFFSYYIGKKLPLSGFFRVVLFLPSIIPEIVLIIIYRYFIICAMPEFVPSIGNILSTKAGTATPTQNYIAVMFYTLIITGFGTSVLMYSNAMGKVSTEMIEAAKLDGAKGFTEFWHIILPSVFPTVSVFLVTGISGIFINQIHLLSFYQYSCPTQIQTFGYILFHRSTEIVQTGAQLKENYASVLSSFGLMLTAIAVPLTFIFKHFLNKFGPSDK